MKTIAILGGGFSGTITAVNLARLGRGALRICLVNRGAPLGRGVAYGTKRPEHLLNVAARNMSALSDRPNHFVEYLTTRSEYADLPEAELRETFAPRRVYGDYVRGLFQSYCRSGDDRPGVQVDHFDREAVDIDTDDGRPQVVLDDGTRVLADKVLLATGNQSPCEIFPGGAKFEHPAYFDNPWGDWERKLPDRRENVVLLGTGLTMVDAFLTLSAYDWQGTIFAVSRNGLLPLSHFKGIEYAEFPPCDPSTIGLGHLNAMLEDHCGRLRTRGQNPAIVVDKLRPYTQQIWRNFSLEEKREFCKRYKARWNVTRHRIAPQIHAQLSAALDAKKVQLLAGKIDGLAVDGARVTVRIVDKAGELRTLQAGLVLNCTGPRESVASAPLPLFHKLVERGLVRSDEMDMGLDVAPDFTVLDRNGVRSKFLYAMGSLLKGSLWETTAVPELRGQAYRVALALLEQYAFDVPQPVQFPVPVQAEMELLEYCI